MSWKPPSRRPRTRWSSRSIRGLVYLGPGDWPRVTPRKDLIGRFQKQVALAQVYGVYIPWYTAYTFMATKLQGDSSTKTNTAARILVAARELLDRDGPEAVAMRPVAEKVGITPMAIYRHYADRVSLLNAVADEGFGELAGRVQALRLKGSVEERLMQIAEVFVDSALGFPNLYHLMFLAPREGARQYPRDFVAGRSPTFNPTVRVLEEAMRRGELRTDDPVEIAFEMSAISHGLIVLYLGGRVGLSAKKFRQLFQRSFRRYLNGLRA
jgi:AcrR family transcriptional regulator